MPPTNTTHAFAGACAPYVRLLQPAPLVQGTTLTAYPGGPPTYLTRCGRYVERARLADPTRGERATCAACQR